MSGVGSTVAGAGAHELRVVDPATLRLVATVPTVDPAVVPGLVAEARAAQRAWSETAPAERVALLARAARLIVEQADELADTVVAETGKPRVEALTSELYPALDTLAWLARRGPKVLARERLRMSQPHLLHKRAWLTYEPLGVVGVIAPWNFPFAIPFTQVAYALAAGNAVVLKPSELTPLSALQVERVLRAAGVPGGLVQIAQGGPDVGAALVTAGVDKVVFTGSVAAARSVAAAAGERLVPVTLELGGKDPMLVLDDADLARTVDGALWASFLNCGQVCSGVERIYVEGPLYEPFVEELARRARELRLGEDVGPLISEAARERVDGLVADAVERGAHVHAGGNAAARTGWFYEPTVLSGVAADSRLEREEIFGPVVSVSRVHDEHDAITAANDSAFALGASVWTRDGDRARRLGSRLRAGSVWHNDHAYSYGSTQASWGGRGGSGFGRTHSKHGLYELSVVKFVDRDAGRLSEPWWYPYDDRAAEAFRGALAALYGGSLSRRASALWRERRSLVTLARRYLR